MHRSAPSSVIALIGLGILVVGLAIQGCEMRTTPTQTVRDSIERHGGERFERLDLEFDFRGDAYRVVRADGRFLYERKYRQDGASIRDWMANEGVGREVEGQRVELDASQRASLESTVNSVVYFALLPFRLLDPAARHRDLGEAEIDGEPYQVVEVTFLEEGGGRDWEDRFVYWFHRNDHTLDFMAYRFDTGEGGTRFRRAVNRRQVGGLLLQDWENLTADPAIEDIARYPEWLGSPELRLVSMVEMEEVRVGDPPDWDALFPTPDEAPESDPSAGVQVVLSTDRFIYPPGGEMRIRHLLVNRLAQPTTLRFPTAQRYDLLILEGDEVIHRWSEDRAFAQVEGELTLGGGEEGPAHQELLEAPRDPGDYRLRVVVTTGDGPLQAELPFRVEAP